MKNNRLKRLLLAAVVLSLTGALEVGAQALAQWPEVTSDTKAGSRWWWMGSAVDQENLRQLMEQYAEAGFGTLEITPIYGVQGNSKNNIAFLSEQWLDLLRYVKEQGSRLGIGIDMTDG